MKKVINVISQKRALAALLVIVAIVIGVTFYKRARGKDYHKDRGAEYYSQGQYDEATIEYMSARRFDPSDMEAIRQLGMIWFKQGALDEALPFLGAALEKEPDNVELKLTLAETWNGIGFFAEAAKLAEEVLDAEPANGKAMMVLADASRSPEQLEACRRRLEAAGNRSASHFLASAMLAAKEGDVAGAMQEAREALKMDPDYGEAHVMIAALLFQNGDEIAGEQALQKASAVSTDRSPVRLQYARHLLQTGRPSEAKEALLLVVADVPDLIPARLLLAEAAAAEKNYDLALEHLNEALRRSQSFGAELLKGRVYLASGEVEKSVEILERLVAKTPNHPAANYWLAVAFQKQERTDDATEALQRALQANPSFVEAEVMLARLNLRAGNVAAVIPAMTALVERQPSNLEAGSLLFDALRQEGDFTAAEQFVEQRMAQDPGNYRNRLLMGMVRIGQERYPEARAEYEAALAESSSEEEQRYIRFLLTQVSAQQGDLDAGLKDVQNAIEATPDDYTGYLNKARLLRAQGEWQKAEAACLEAISRSGGMLVPSLELVELFKQTGKYKEAVDHLESILVRDTEGILAENAVIHGQLGFLYYELDQMEKSRAAYEKTIALQPEDPASRNNLAWLLAFRMNDFEAALVQANQARELRPNDPLVADTLGWIHLQSGDPVSARVFLEEAGKNAPDNAEIQYHLGSLYLELGLPNLARTALQAAQDVGANGAQWNSEMASRLAFLDKLGEAPETLGLEALEALVAEYGSEPVLLQLIGGAAVREGNHERAKAAFTEALAASPQLYPAVIGLAELYAGEGEVQNLEQAEKLAAQAKELDAFDWRPSAVQGRVALRRGDMKTAYQLLQESSARTTDPSVLFDFAWTQYAQGMVPLARETMQRALAMDGGTFDREGAAQFLALTDAAPPAQDVVAKALAADPKYVPALMWQAMGADPTAAVDPTVAESGYRSVLETYPDFTPAKLKLAQVLVQRAEGEGEGGDGSEDAKILDEAEQLARDARDGLADSEEPAKVLGIVLSLKGDHSAAARLLSGIRDATLIDGRLQFYLGRSEAAQGNASAAIDALNSAVSSGLPSAMETAAKDLLATLENEETKDS